MVRGTFLWWYRFRLFVGAVLSCGFMPATALAGAFEAYGHTSTFSLPDSAHGLAVLSDGRLLTVVGTDVYIEEGVGLRTYDLHGSLPEADFSSFGPGFLRISPDGHRLAVGNSGGATFTNYQIGIFDVGALSGRWLDAPHFDAEWVDDVHLAVSGGVFGSPSFVSMLDVGSADPAHPVSPIVVNNIGGASGGIAFDAAGNLYTGNGYAFGGGSATGAVKSFDFASWSAALAGGVPLDFEAGGTPVVEVLSAAPLRFDAEGNLLVGGGDFDGGDFGFAALVNGTAIADALAGMGMADVSDTDDVRRLDPDPLSDFNYYNVTYNGVTGEIYVQDGTTVFAFAVPEPTAVLLLGVGAVALFRFRGAGRRNSRGHERSAASRGLKPAARVLVCYVFVPAAHAEIPDLKSHFNANLVDEDYVRGMEAEISDLKFQIGSPFAVQVVDYDPAPGLWVRDPLFNDPYRALGAPIGGGTEDANLDSLVTLGGFGGSIVLAFDHTVVDDPLNPHGLDAIVFGNAIWQLGDSFIPDPNRHWAECGTIEIAQDVNGDGLANDPWYLVPGSHLTDPPNQFAGQTWDDAVGDPTFPPSDASWIPFGRRGEWQTVGYLLPAAVFAQSVVVNPEADDDREGIYGYADYTPTVMLGDWDADNVVDEAGLSPEDFYTVPDDPFTVGISAASGGGDAFDIAWAVDPANGLPAGLVGFDFIRIVSAVNFVHGVFGEFSTELDAVADVAPDPFGDVDNDGDIDLADAAGFLACYRGNQPGASTCARVDREPDGEIDLVDFSAFAARLSGPLS